VLELGGKNALVVCDDADLDCAVQWSLASAFSNAGQRCAAASRLVVFDAVYDDFRERLVTARAPTTRSSSAKEFAADPGVARERDRGRGRVAARPPRLVAGADDRRGRPGRRRAVLPRAVRAGDDPVPRARPRGGDRARERLTIRPDVGDPHGEHPPRDALRQRRAAGVVVVNGGTHGSEPHMGFGGVKQSGTGWREAGVEALDVYTEWKYVNLITDPSKT
jgi:aldehyde dehydrogenase (NAD+)